MAVVATVLLYYTALAATTEATGRITNVIVYLGQALVTRTIEVDLPEGTSELIVGDLPEKIISESLYSQAPPNVTVLSVRYRQRAVKKDSREEVKKLDAQIEEVSRRLKHAERNHAHNGNLWKRYNPYWNLTQNTSKSDHDRGLLQFEPIQQLTGYLEGKLNELHEKNLALEDEIADIKKELDVLNRKRKKLTAGRSRNQREAIIFLNKSDNKPAAVELNYLVNGANWTPQYNLRAKPVDSTALIEYNAVVHQSSGEHWNNAALALSTAEPSLVASPPEITPMEITLSQTPTRYSRRISISNVQGIDSSTTQQQSEQAQQQVQYIDRSQKFKELIQSRKSQAKGGRMNQIALNSIAFDNQMLELEADKETLKEMNFEIAVIKRTEGVSVMYKISGKLTLPSRSDQQLLTIATINTQAQFTLLATPLLTDYVYLQAEILNDSNTILLPGPASMYRNGEFVGKGQMALVTIGQKFTSGFGIDSQVQVTREFKDKKTETLWGNRIDEHEYRIEINNYKNTPVKLRLLERLPYTENPNIQIILTKPSQDLSTDKEYIRTEKKKGILRWDMTLGPNTTDAKATVLEYGFTMKYDNDMHIRAAK